MRWLKLVIGRVLGITQDAGRVPQTVVSQIGGGRNIAKGLVQRAKQELKAKQLAVKADIQDQSAKVETLRAQTRTKKSLEAGTQQEAPAPQPAKSKPNNKLSPAKQATVGQSRNKDKQPAQAERGVAGKQPATRANQSSQQKPASKAAKSTTAAKSRKQGQSQPAKRVRGSQAKTPVRKTRQHAK